MNGIIVLESVLEEIQNSSKEYTLFGIKDWLVSPEKNTYDLLYHSIERVPFSSLSDQFFSVPLLPYDANVPKEQAIAYMHIDSLAKENPFVKTYAIRVSDVLPTESGSSIKRSHFKFYDTKIIKGGVHIEQRPLVRMLTDDHLSTRMPHKFDELQEKIELMNLIYSL